MERQAKELLFEYADIFESVCIDIGLKFKGEDISAYTYEECESIIKWAKVEYSEIWD